MFRALIGFQAVAQVLLGTHSARVKREKTRSGGNLHLHKGAKLISNVPVLNYYEVLGKEGGSLLEQAEKTREWIVLAKGGATDQQIKDLCAHGKSTCSKKGKPDEGGVPYIVFKCTEKELQSVLDAAKVELSFVEIDTAIKLSPGEVKAASTVQSSPHLWGLEKIGAAGKTGGKGAHVYVLDTGIRTTHSVFGGRAVPTAVCTANGYSCDKCNGASDTSCARDANGHGTHCAGTVGGAGYGVAPEATIHAMQILDDSGSGSYSWIVAGFDFLTNQGESPKVASLSIGGPGRSFAMRMSVDTAVTVGITVVVAAGNENSDACSFSPAFISSAITVGSTTSYDSRSYFSNYGSCTDIWAPGSDIVSAAHYHDDYVVGMSGTSMACPHVAGAAAVLLMNDTTVETPEQVRSSLFRNGKMNIISDLGWSDTNVLLHISSFACGQGPCSLIVFLLLAMSVGVSDRRA